MEEDEYEGEGLKEALMYSSEMEEKGAESKRDNEEMREKEQERDDETAMVSCFLFPDECRLVFLMASYFI